MAANICKEPLVLKIMYNDDFLLKKLQERISHNAFRTLKLPHNKIDFCSNDYLGIVHNRLIGSFNKNDRHGSTGSRLLSGNYTLIEEVEKELAIFHDCEAALIFNSGYDANIGLLPCVAQRGDTIIYDQLVHASIRDGIRLSFAQSFSFLHNDAGDLEKKLQNAVGNIFVITESVFSMDGDTCELALIINQCKQFNAHLIIDEAHGIGIIGNNGEGLAQSEQLHHECFARVYTFGKACGCHGAVITGSQRLKDYLVNFARSFIFSTALPDVAIRSIQKSYALFPSMKKERTQLNTLVQVFSHGPFSSTSFPSVTPIQPVIIPGNEAVKKAAAILQQNNFDIRPVLYPSVPNGKERLRIVLHAFNTIEQVKKVCELLG